MGDMRAESTRALTRLKSGDGPLGVRVRPSSLSVTVTVGQRAPLERV
jgi:hypothetical protein